MTTSAASPGPSRSTARDPIKVYDARWEVEDFDDAEVFNADGAAIQTATADGIDLEGTVVNRGVELHPGSVALADGWYSGYYCVAIKGKGVVRSYLSTGNAIFGRELERRTRDLLEQRFHGRRSTEMPKFSRGRRLSNQGSGISSCRQIPRAV